MRVFRGTLTGTNGSHDGIVDSKVARTSALLATILDTKLSRKFVFAWDDRDSLLAASYWHQ